MEHYKGFVEKIDKNIAYVVLIKDDETFYVDWDAEDLANHGVQERRRFNLYVKENGKIALEAIPDVKITEERYKEIENMVAGLGNDPQDDY